jgi:hypothetical protein
MPGLTRGYWRMGKTHVDIFGRERGGRWRTGRVHILARHAPDPEKGAKPQQQRLAEEL